MRSKFHTQRRVEFADSDMAGIAHFTNFLHYMEQAEHEFMRSCGFSVIMHDEKGAFGFPKISAGCNYRSPVRPEQMLEIQLTVRSEDGKTIAFDCEFFCEGKPVAAGQLKVVCCRFPNDRLPYPILIPDHVQAALANSSTDC